jgi:acyl-CoA synthetase (NDP forming)
MSMKTLWHPRGIAIVGASATPNSLGHRLLTYLRDHAFDGQIYPVNPRYTNIEGLACFPSVIAIPGIVELGLILVGADRVMSALKECVEKRIGYAVVHASGFAETGERGQALEREMAAFAHAHGMRIIGPNCIGLVSPSDHLIAGFSPLFSRVHFEPGELAMVTQSGALGYGIVSLAVERGLRFSHIVNTGNEADLTTAEFIAEFLDDERSSTILVYSEGIKQPERWRELGACSCKRGKPVIILKSGRSEVGSRAVTSHTASLAGDDATWHAAFRSVGMLRVDDVDEMLDLAAVFEQPRRPAGPGVGVMTTSGGAGILAVDGLSQAGLTVPDLHPKTCEQIRPIFPAYGTVANPLDLTGAMLTDPVLFRTSLHAMASDPSVHAVLVCVCVLQGAEVDRAIDDLLAVFAETDKPILVSRTGGEFLAPGASARLQQAGIPVFPTPTRAARALRTLLEFTVHRVKSNIRPLPPTGSAPRGWPTPGQILGERETKALLSVAGLPVTREVLCTTADGAARAAERMGFPVVVKIDSPDIPHKTEVGGLRLNLRDAEAVRSAFDAVTDSVRKFKPDAKLNGCLVQEQLENSVTEILLGVSPSPMGPMVSVGVGGIFVEVLNDVGRRLAPLTADEATTMLQELRGYKLLTGARGQPAADIDALANLIAKVSEIAMQWPGEWELDLNPVLVMQPGHGCRIADALLFVR